MGCVSLVSRRFYQLCCAPQLLCDVRAEADALKGAERALDKVRSLLPWLQRHGAHACRLFLGLSPRYDAAGRSAMGQLTVDCLSACSTAGQLQELELSWSTPVPHMAWLPAMRSLRRLDLWRSDAPVPPGIEHRTQLEYLNLRIPLDPSARLPSSLTHLDLIGGRGMPIQAGGRMRAAW